MANDRVRVDQVNVVVPDMAAAVDFYRLLGCEVEESGNEWDAHHRRVKAGDAIDFDLDSVQFASEWDRGWPGGTGVVIGFRTEDREAVDRLYERLTAAGYEGEQPPYDAFWGSRFAIIQDSGGNAIGLMSPPDDEHRSPPVLPEE